MGEGSQIRMFQHTIAGRPATAVSVQHVAPGGIEAQTHTTASRRRGAVLRLLPGQVVEGTRYRLRRWLGDGGMGVVYEAEHMDLERPVAMKILRAQIAEHEAERERFRQEARTTTRIVSPHVVEVLDFGFLLDGRVFYVMELLRGRPLSYEIARGPIAPARVIGLLRQMCAGLAAAHESGVIHRDVKPDNAMVCEHGGRSCVKLLDFGIAAPVSTAASPRASGTPEYMAPEQIEGKAFDVRLDVYALGCTAYEMLTGEPPFVRETTLDVLTAHLEQLPSPPSKTAKAPQIPAALEQVVMRCLAKNPEDRFASMAELEAALCEAQIAAALRTEWDDLPLPAVAPDRRDRIAARMPRARATPGSRRRRWIVGAAAALATVGLAVWLPSRSVDAADHERVEALVAGAREAATRGAYVYPTQGEANDTAYATLVQLESIEGPSEHIADTEAAELRRTIADELITLGDVYWEDASARPYARDYYVQAVLFDPDSSHARMRAGFTPGEIIDLRVRAETQDFSEPELAAAGPLVALAVVGEGERAVAIAEVAGGGLCEDAASKRSPHARSDARDAPRRREDAAAREIAAVIPAPATVREVTSTSPTRGDRTGARALARQGQRAFDRGNRDDAASLFQRALALDPASAAAMRGLSDVYFDRGDHQRALQFARRATQIAPRDGAAFLRLGDAWFKLLDYTAARRAYQRALDLGRRDATDRLRRLTKETSP